MSRRPQKSIFDSPAIVKLIHAYLDPCEGASLARSSRSLFQTLMPLLWERVDGAAQLLTLLPALGDGKKDEKDIKVLTENDFSRFNVYAPWIKHLEVCKDRKTLWDIRMGALSRYTVARTLLPNVMSITCTNTDRTATIPWVLPFLSPSLRRLQFATLTPVFSPKLRMAESFTLLHILSEKCPNLQTLAIHPELDKRKQDTEAYALGCVPEDSRAKLKDQIQHGLTPFIACISPLVSFASSSMILDQACFTTISTWPLLESLSITLDPLQGRYEVPELPDTAFPSLKSLALYWLPDMKTFRMFWNTPVLVSKLTSVKLLPSGDLCREKGRFNRILLPIFTTLVERSPNLQDLWFEAVDPDAMRAWYSVPISTIEVLKKLALQRLYIEAVDLREAAPDEDNDDGKGNEEDEENEDGDEDEDEDDEPRVDRCTDVAERLTTMFPNLKELSLPRQRSSFSDLPTFQSKMPELEVLRFDFELWSLSKTTVDLESIPRYRQSPFKILEANFLGIDEHTNVIGLSNLKYEDVTFLVRYLFSLWPNVQLEALPDNEGLEEYPAHEAAIALVNKHLSALSYCNRDPSMKYEDIKILNENSWKSCGK
ncbi:hypothetical protein FRC07_011053 [Ceratobasidium sp. 392]|nr:hypothetical protein FRC07_011053 [Ceratobasidium sp. 392]